MPAEVTSGGPYPMLKTALKGRPLLWSEPESFRITANAMAKIQAPKEGPLPNFKQLSPIQTIKLCSQLTAKDRDVNIQSFVFDILAMPAKK